MNDRREGAAGLGVADDVWLEAALHEALTGETPPDLRLRILRASPEQAAAAAARVDAARAATASRPWWAAAAVLFGALVVGGVFALQRFGGAADAPAVVAQEPSRELDVADARQLAVHLARTTTVALTALQGPDGARLPNEPEYSGIVHDGGLLRKALCATLPADAATKEPFAVRDTQAELRLAGEDGFVRLRVSITGEEVRVGTAKFAFASALPAEMASKLRGEWQILAKQKPPARQRMQVHTQRQLIAAIGSDRTIELVGGPFVLTGSDDDGELPANPAVEFRDPHPVPFLVIKGVRNLRLCTIGGPVRVLGKSPVDVVRCEGCSDVTFEGLVLGHDTSVEHYCTAPVLTLKDCKNVVVRDCELFGCGTEGVVAEQVDGFRMERGEIHTCRNGVAYFTKCKRVDLVGVLFRDSGADYSAFSFRECEQAAFVDCVVRGIDGGMGAKLADDDFLFGIMGDEAVHFVRGAIRGNRTNRVANSKLLLVREGTDERDNGPDVEVKPPSAGANGGR
ncbi:MAG: hypothetical protein ACK501_18595 [Planctomycetota bacterium]